MASALEQFVNNVRTHSSNGNYKELAELLPKCSEVLSRNSQHLDNVLETLNVQQHSLGILAVLVAKLSNTPTADQAEPLLSQFQEFINDFNVNQVRFSADLYAELCHLFSKWMVLRKTPMRGIEVLRKAISRIQQNKAQLTSVHADLCQLCMLSKCMKPAIELLDIDITSILPEFDPPVQGHQFDAEHFLRYFYYGGMIYTAVKQYKRALYFFEVALTTPSFAVSHIMLESYKKYILVSLVLHGKVNNLPKYTSQAVSRFIKPLSQPYLDIATAYSTNSIVDVQAAVNKHREVLERDNNMGLAKQVSASLTKKNIQRLTKTFITLSLSDVASRVQLAGPVEAESLILNMIEDGEIFATINQKDGMVVFKEDPEKYNSPEMLQRLRKEMTICMELDRKIQAMEEEILVNPQFVKKAGIGAEEEIPPPATAQTSKASVSGVANTYSV
ncbi:COP9 signalosome complex subunit 3 [Neocloeon triangulifer]|uniref:COP9 signalosome complex subunit 3 n=1 Tax=Neocloeon triangulifer TaxID=2078957 RepID=UPI00286FA6FE|nr:COP9 signalosome complex subunit 3 [Neocloeon triangulifer]